MNKEKYISFTKVVEGTKIRFRFIDSFKFMSTSIEKLSNYLENDKKIITRAHCRNDVEFSLLIRKGVFPYEYIDSWDKLNETCLPPKQSFYRHLYHDNISDESYDHALNVWNKFNVKSLGEYSDLHLKKFLPFAEFSFVDEANFASSDIINHPNDSEIGYILDCDLDYPEELHESHSDLPLAPEHMVPPATFSTSKLKKLLLTLYPKRNYVLHYRILMLTECSNQCITT